jgi:Tol biopolymer transport system component/predicted Ser/Thr protein kinase
MRPDRWRQVEQLYHSAFEREESARDAFLREACREDEELRREVRSLLDQTESGLLNPSLQLGPYQIVGVLGTGGMGTVYQARDTRLNRMVAIKVSDARFSNRFEREARAVAALNHPHICTLYDVGPNYLVMECVEGEPLEGPMPVTQALRLAIQMADAMKVAHGQGIIHRDLKPGNVLVTKSGVKILDFGLAKLIESQEQPEDASRTLEPSTVQGMIVGTPSYMSPEQAQGKPVDARSDIFSFGSLLYELLTGKRAFRGDTKLSILSAILEKEPEPVSSICKGIPAELERIIARCLRKDAERRFQHMDDVKAALEDLKEESESGTREGAAAVARKQRRWWPWAAGAAALLVAAGLFFLGLRWEHNRNSQTVFQQLTFRRGTIDSARFAPDGHSIVYGAYWDGRPVQLFSVRPESPESSPLPLPGADILSISSTGEMALSLDRQPNGWCPFGTLARAPLAGGTPRKLLEMVQQADWNPDGSALAVVRAELPGGGSRLEYPAGKVLYQADGWLSHPRFSPQGDAIAFAEHPVKADDKGHVSLVDLRGNKRDLTGDYPGGVQGIAWTPAGDEVWYTAAESGTNFELRAVSRRGGPSRLVVRVPGRLILQDISRNGRVLLTGDTIHPSVMVQRADSDRERDVAWLDFSDVRALSPDGTWVLLTEAGVGSRTEGAYLRKTDGSPAVRIGDGFGYGLSPDGKWALSVMSNPPPQLIMLPTGAGESRVLPRGKIAVYEGFTAAWFADSRRFVLTARQGSRSQLYIQDIQGGEPRAISGSEGLALDVGCSLSPDQKYVAAIAIDIDRKIRIEPVEGGSPRLVPGVEPDEQPAGWTADGRSLYVYRTNTEAPTKVYLVDVASGQRKLWKEITPADPAGTYGIDRLVVNPDGKAYAYNLFRILSDLYVVDGLK